MRGEQQNKTGSGVIGRWTIGMVPQQIPKSRRRGTNIGVRVVAIDAPSLQSPLHNEVMARTAHVVHDLFATIFLKGLADARAEGLQHFIPRGPSPFPSAPRPRTLHRIKDAIGIMNLRDRCRTLGA